MKCSNNIFYRRILIFMVSCILLVSGCQTKEGPVAIKPDLDACDECIMAISDLRDAGEILLPEGKIYKFDDLGCLVQFLEKRKLSGVGQVYVLDYSTGDWVRGENAIYVQGKVRTPMDYGIIAFKSMESAQAFTKQQGGKIFKYHEVLTIFHNKSFGKGGTE